MIVSFRLYGADKATEKQINGLADLGVIGEKKTRKAPVYATVEGKFSKTGEVDEDYWDIPYKVYTGDLRTLLKIIPGEWVRLESDFTASAAMAIGDALYRIEAIIEKQQSAPTQFNEKVSVVVPDLGLLMLDQVCVLEDSCTNSLQDELDEGWRILAVCPQPDRRRPDYILGRRKAKT